MDTNTKIHRRNAIKGMGTGLAAFTLSPLLAGQNIPANGLSATGLEDPVSKYPKPPFNKQSQPWPGLVSKMDPRPDHGEKTYKGSGRPVLRIASLSLKHYLGAIISNLKRKIRIIKL